MDANTETIPFIERPERILPCDVCGTWTLHFRAGQYYVCGCGDMVLYIVNDAPHCQAVL